MLPVAAAAAPWRVADPRRRVCHVHADHAAPARAFRGGSNGGVPPSVVERASSARPRSGRAAAVNKCGSGSPTSTGKCGGSRAPHPGHRDCQPGAPPPGPRSGTAPPSEPPGRAATGAGAELQAALLMNAGDHRPPRRSCSPWRITPAALGHDDGQQVDPKCWAANVAGERSRPTGRSSTRSPAPVAGTASTPDRRRHRAIRVMPGPATPTGGSP